MPVIVPRELQSTHFGGLRVLHDDQVLTPRPWTLLHSAWAVELLAGHDEGPVLELCAGVGHIGQEVTRRTGCSLVQVDADPRACELARANADHNDLADLVEIRCADMGSALTAEDPLFPLILADPPYLPTGDCGAFPADPRTAIDGGPDGLALIRRVLAVIRASLRHDGVALVQLRGRSQLTFIGAGDLGGLVCSALRSHDRHRAVAAFVHGRSTSGHGRSEGVGPGRTG